VAPYVAGTRLSFPLVASMIRQGLRPAAATVAAALLATAAACGVSSTGLGPSPDGAVGGAGGTAWCPVGLTDQANWPAKTSYTSCSRPCGPDDRGVQTCSQSDRSQCQQKSGCVCLESPCVACAACAFYPPLSDCYVPTNVSAASRCADGVSVGGGCAPACGRVLCLQADGKSACVCNANGKYACADWDGSAWQ
jgi:hypothetical protein